MIETMTPTCAPPAMFPHPLPSEPFARKVISVFVGVGVELVDDGVWKALYDVGDDVEGLDSAA